MSSSASGSENSLGRLLSIIIIGVLCWFGLQQCQKDAAQRSHDNLDRYYTDARQCDPQAADYLNCLNDKASKDLNP